jgi:acetyl-CoA carboxylase biotin carboxyl carrier protein
MKIKEIRELIDFISSSGLAEVNIETEEFKISVKKNAVVTNVTEITGPAPVTSQPTINGTEAPTPAQQAAAEKKEQDKYITIKSPMVGTFYKAANPEAEPFIKVGDTVSTGQPVCIIEAMKLFNEIESDVSGTIVKILVENASPVEFDQPLFLVDPA